MLNSSQIQSLLQELKGWALNGDRLEKEFQFRDFSRAVLFVNKLVNPAEEHQIYPLVRITYNRVLVTVFGLSGAGLREKEFAMVKDVEGIK